MKPILAKSTITLHGKKISIEKKYAISAHSKSFHYQIMVWIPYGKKRQKIKGKLGEWRFFKQCMDFEHLAKSLLNMAVNDETAKDVRTLLKAWYDAVAVIVQALEANVKE